MKILVACRVGIVWAICLQLLIAPLVGAINVYEPAEVSEHETETVHETTQADDPLPAEPELAKSTPALAPSEAASSSTEAKTDKPEADAQPPSSFDEVSPIQPAATITPVPSELPQIDGAFMITAYSFQGQAIRYVQVANTSRSVALLDGWVVQALWPDDTEWQTTPLHGYVPPGHKVVIAESTVMPDATFTYKNTSPAMATRPHTIQLVPPADRGLNRHTVTISISDSSGASRTPRDNSTNPETFYFQRNISGSSGNYLTSFTASATQPDVLESDPLYMPQDDTPLQIVELYPRSLNCSPADDGPLCYDYVKVFNAASQSVELGDYRLRTGAVGQSSTASNTAYLSGQVAAGEYAVLQLNLADGGSHVWIEDAYGLAVYAETSVSYGATSGHDGMTWSYNPTRDSWQWTAYPTPHNAPNRFGLTDAVNACSGVMLSEVAANYSDQFIEVYNPGNEIVDISGCQLQTNRSSVTSYVFGLNTKLVPGEHKAIMIADTRLALSKTTTGTVYLLNSDGSAEIDATTYGSMSANTSWALIDGEWQQTYVITRNKSNVYQQFADCEAGYVRNESTGRCNRIMLATRPAPCAPNQYRNPETGRCRLLAATSALAPCREGQYRHPDTNRCRNIASTASALTPCRPGQVRNPATNRCRAIASTASTLKPCQEGWERNPETNRCRKIASIAAVTDFPVEPIIDTAQGFAAWWTLGGLTLLGAGYGAWEWRRELAAGLRRVGGMMSK